MFALSNGVTVSVGPPDQEMFLPDVPMRTVPAAPISATSDRSNFKIGANHVAPAFDVVQAKAVCVVACAPEEGIFAALDKGTIIVVDWRVVDRQAVDDAVRFDVAIDQQRRATDWTGPTSNCILHGIVTEFGLVQERPLAVSRTVCPADFGLCRVVVLAPPSCLARNQLNAPPTARPSPIWRRIAVVRP